MSRFFTGFLLYISIILTFNIFNNSADASYGNKSLKIKSATQSLGLKDNFDTDNIIDSVSVKKYEKRLLLPGNEILSHGFLIKFIANKVYIIETMKNISADNNIEENIYNAFDFQELTFFKSKGESLENLSDKAYDIFKLQYIERQPYKFFINNFLEYRNMEYLRIFCENLTCFLNNRIFYEENEENKNMKSFFESVILINCALDIDCSFDFLNLEHYINLKNLIKSENLSRYNIYEEISFLLSNIKKYMDDSFNATGCPVWNLIKNVLNYT